MEEFEDSFCSSQQIRASRQNKKAILPKRGYAIHFTVREAHSSVENTDEPLVDCEQDRDVHVLNGAPHPDETNDFRKSEPRVLLKVQDSLINFKHESGEVDESFHDPMGPRKKVRCNGYFRKMFLLSLLPEISDMTEMQMRKFKRRVLEVIDEILTEDPAVAGGYTPYDSFSGSSYAPSTSESSDFSAESRPKEPSPI